MDTFFFYIIYSLAAAYALFLHLTLHVFEIVQVQNTSMSPALKPGDYVIIDKISSGLIYTPGYYKEKNNSTGIMRWNYPGSRKLEPGDMVAFFAPDAPGEKKKQNTIPVLTVKRITKIIDTPFPQYYVEGDNANHSLDSRHFGPVPGESIIGRVFQTEL